VVDARSADGDGGPDSAAVSCSTLPHGLFPSYPTNGFTGIVLKDAPARRLFLASQRTLRHTSVVGGYRTHTMRLNCARISLGALAAMGLMALSAGAAPINGTVNWTGTVDATPTTIDFYLKTLGDMTFSINLPTTGSFSDMTQGDMGTIKPLNAAANPPGTFPGGPVLDWVTFSDGISLDLASLNAAPASLCSASVTANCGLVAGSPVIFNQIGPNVSAAFNGGGTARLTADAATAGDSPFTLGVTTQFANTTIAALATQLATTGHIVDSYSVTATATAGAVPEPGTTSAMLGGLLVLAGLVTRRARRNQ